MSIDGETDPVMEENPVEMPTHEPKFVEHGLKQEESRFYQNSQNRNEGKNALLNYRKTNTQQFIFYRSKNLKKLELKSK